MKPKKKSISSFFGVPPMPITNTEKSKKTEKELTAVNHLTEHSQSDVALSELAENAHVATNSQDLQDDDSFEDTPQVTHNQLESVSNSEPDPPSGTQITTWSVNSSEGNTPYTPFQNKEFHSLTEIHLRQRMIPITTLKQPTKKVQILSGNIQLIISQNNTGLASDLVKLKKECETFRHLYHISCSSLIAGQH